MQAMMMFYDIPEQADIPNPSAEFRQFAFRINLSCWIIHEGDLPRAAFTLDSIRRVGGDWHTLAVASEDEDKVVGLATKYINREIDVHLRRAETSLAGSNLQLAEAEDREQGLRAYRSRAASIARRVNLLIRDMRRLAGRWELSHSQLSLAKGVSVISNIQSRMYRRMAEYVRVTEELRKQGHTAMANAAQAGQVPEGILADYAEENGIESDLR